MKDDRKITSIVYDRDYVAELGMDLNQYELIDDYGVDNLQVTTSIIMAILNDLGTVDHRLHISEFSHNAIQSEVIDLITNSLGPKKHRVADYDPHEDNMLTTLDYRAIREIAGELSKLPSIEPIYKALKRSVRGVSFIPIGVKYVNDNIVVDIAIK